jgi:hypothetical protein
LYLYFVGLKCPLLFTITCKFVTQTLMLHKRNNITTSIYHSRTRTEFPFLGGNIKLLTYFRPGLHFSEGCGLLGCNGMQSVCRLSPSGILLGLFLDPEDGGHVPPKRHPLSEIHGFSNQKTVPFIVTAVRSELHSSVYVLYSIS